MSELMVKIQKLLALSGSPNEHEAQSALARANALMLENNLTYENVAEFQARSESREYITEKRTLETKYGGRQLDGICRILQKYFFVKVVYIGGHRGYGSNRTVAIFGESSNVDVAKHVFNTLYNVFPPLWDAYRVRTFASRRDQTSYYYGLEKGFGDKLDEERKSATAMPMASPNAPSLPDARKNEIVLATESELGTKFRQVFTDLQTRTNRQSLHSNNALEAGRRDGRNINVNRSLAGNPKQLEG